MFKASSSHPQIRVDLSLLEAARGCTKDIEVDLTLICERCHGSRADPGSRRITCAHCGGSGMVCVRACVHACGLHVHVCVPIMQVPVTSCFSVIAHFSFSLAASHPLWTVPHAVHLLQLSGGGVHQLHPLQWVPGTGDCEKT